MSSPSATGSTPDGSRARPAFERIALLLQGGGALGAYQALAKADLHPDWVAGISVAINSALIVGNPPEKRVERLRAFWETVTQPHLGVPYLASVDIKSDMQRQMINQFRAMGTMLWGAASPSTISRRSRRRRQSPAGARGRVGQPLRHRPDIGPW